MHRLAIAAFPLALFAAACLVHPAPEDHPPLVPHVSAAERDLVLELALANEGPFSATHPPELRWTIRNGSATEAHAVVQGGDGSECGWREPVFTLTAEALGGDGAWRPLPRRGYGRCGVYDPVWRDEIVPLSPRESLALEWVPWAAAFFDLTDVERVRFRAEYRFTAGAAGKGPDALRAAGGDGCDLAIPPFTLVSAPLEVAIGR